MRRSERITDNHSLITNSLRRGFNTWQESAQNSAHHYYILHKGAAGWVNTRLKAGFNSWQEEAARLSRSLVPPGAPPLRGRRSSAGMSPRKSAPVVSDVTGQTEVA